MTAPTQTEERHTLTGLTGEVLDLREAIEDAEGDEEMEAMLQQVMDATEEDLDKKLEAYCRLIRDLEIEGDARKAEADRMRDLSKRSHTKRNKVKAWLLRNLDMLGIKKRQAGPFSLSVRNNGGMTPIEWETQDIERIPEDYITHKPVINTDAVRKALDDGIDIGFARLGQRGTNLQIK